MSLAVARLAMKFPLKESFRMARLALHHQASLPEADPTTHSPEVAVMFAHAPELVDYAARDQAEIAGVHRQPHVGKLRQQSVKEEITEAQHPRFLASNALRVDDIIPLTVFLDKFRDCFWHILQVAVHHDGSVTTHIIERSGQNGLMPIVTR